MSRMPPQGQRRRLTTEEFSQGHGHAGMWVFTAMVTIIFGVSQSVTNKAWNRFQTSGSATQFHADGRQRATTPRQDGFIVVQARRHLVMNATTLRVEHAVGVNISMQTVHNCPLRSGPRSRRECIHIPSIRLHRQAHLNWTKDHVD